MNPNLLDDCIEKPFVYETYIESKPATNKYTTELQSQQLQTQAQCVLEERGEPGSNIFTVANIFTENDCNEIVNCIMKNSSLWRQRDIGPGSNNYVECKFLVLDNLINLDIPGAKELDNIIFQRVSTLLKGLRAICPNFKGLKDDGYTLRKIYGGTKLHADGVHSKTGGFEKFVRCLSLIIVLNDDYDGGVFCFPKQRLKFRVQKGEAVMFPPYWTHPHSVTSVGEGQARYTINTWILENFID
jgi:hypothetical protein